MKKRSLARKRRAARKSKKKYHVTAGCFFVVRSHEIIVYLGMPRVQ